MAPVPVVVLGTDHLAEWDGELGRPDILAPSRENEIEDVIERLARFGPTKVALEVLASREGALNKSYAAYRRGEHELQRNEVHIIGFRLAARLGHSRVHAVDADWTLDWDGLNDYLAAHPEKRPDGLSQDLLGMITEGQDLARSTTLAAYFAWTNANALAANDREYLDRWLSLGLKEGQGGLRLVASWYRRNLWIFANILALAEPADRILVVIGSGHANSVRHFIETSGRLESVDPVSLLV